MAFGRPAGAATTDALFVVPFLIATLFNAAPALILLDRRGRKLQHDEDTFVWDPFFVHRFAHAGEYVAVVQPTHTRNDPG